MGSTLKPPDEHRRVVKVSRVQKFVALGHYEKLDDKQFEELYHDIMAEASRRNSERAK